MAENHSKSTVKERLTSFIRRRQTWGFLISVVVMAIISLAFFYPDNFEGNDLRQHDMMQGVANGQEIKAFHEATGEDSRWTNSLFSGMPTFQIAPSYPSNSLFSWITSVYGLGLPAPSNLLFMMMLGFMILTMAMRIRWEAGLIGAIAWGFSTYFIIIIGAGHIWKFVTLAYIPPTIAGIILAYRGRFIAGTALTSLAAMMQLSANHVQMTYYFGFVILGVSIAYLVSSIRHHRMRVWTKATIFLIVAGALAVAANLPNLYHTWKYAKETQRAQSELVTGSGDTADRSYITQYSYGRSETLTLMITNIKGGASARPEGGAMVASTLAQVEGADNYRDPSVDFYLNYTSQYFGEPEGTNGPVYVGVIIFALFLAGIVIVKGPLKWALLILTLLSVMLAWGRNLMWLTDFFIDYIPLYSKFRTPESILVIAEFTIPLLAVIALSQMLGNREALKKSFGPAAAGFGVVGIVCIVALITPSAFGPTVDMSRETETSRYLGQMLVQQGYPQEIASQVSISNPAVYNAIEELHESMVRADALRSFLLLIMAMGALAIARFTKVRLSICCVAIGVLVICDLYPINKRYVNTDSFSRQRGIKPTEIAMTDIDRAILQDTTMNYRVLDVDRFTQADPSYYHKMIGGYHAAKLGRYQDLIDSRLIFSANVLDMLNAKYIVYEGQIEQNPYALGNAWLVDDITYVGSANDEIAALEAIEPSTQAVADSRFSTILGKSSSVAPGDTIYETTYTPNRLTYKADTSGDAIAVFSEVYFPWGWSASIDGKEAEIGRVNYILRAIRIPAGKHEIVMTFNPVSVKWTVTVATIAVILIYLMVAAAIARGLLYNKKG